MLRATFILDEYWNHPMLTLYNKKKNRLLFVGALAKGNIFPLIMEIGDPNISVQKNDSLS